MVSGSELMNLKNILSLALVAIMLASCRSTTPSTQSGDIPTLSVEQPLVTLRMNISNNTSYGPIYIAESEGYFKEFGIQMEYIQINKSPEALALLVSGDIDVYAGVLAFGNS